MLLSSLGKVIVLRAGHSEKAPVSIAVTLSGMLTDSSEVQCKKVLDGIAL